MAKSTTVDAARKATSYDNPVRFDTDARLYKQITDHLVPAIAQADMRSLPPWDPTAKANDMLIMKLEGKEVPATVYKVITEHGGLVPPPDTLYHCIFFSFQLTRVAEQLVIRSVQVRT